MSQVTPPETTYGYSPPSVRQLSVFLDNRVGKLLELLTLIKEDSDVVLLAMSIIESTDYSVVRVVPNNADAARRILRERGLSFSEIDILVVELTEDHTLSDLCVYLLGAELNIRFAYPLMGSDDAGNSLLAVSVDDHVLAGQVLMRKSFRLFGEADLG